VSLAQDIAESVGVFLQGEVTAHDLGGDDNRVACLTPLDYPTGDGVRVWVCPRNGELEITDYGEGYSTLWDHPAQDLRALADEVAVICRDLDVSLIDGRVLTRTSTRELGEALWRVASASVQISQASNYFRPRRRARRGGKGEFLDVVESVFRERQVDLRREHRLVGQSGHTHRASFFLPEHEVILEPVEGSGNWNQVSSVYAKFGDLSLVNGYSRLSVVDDRSESLADDVINLLVQVSEVVEWTARERWLVPLID
jgi:hypothetical protein